MYATRFLALSILIAATGTAAAQTISAEAWVGAPIHTIGAVSRADVAADLQRQTRVALAAPEAWVGTRESARMTAGTLSRAEVLADLNLWRRAGLENAALADTTFSNAPRYARQVAAYQHARQSGAYIAELQHVRGATGSTATDRKTPAAQ